MIIIRTDVRPPAAIDYNPLRIFSFSFDVAPLMHAKRFNFPLSENSALIKMANMRSG